MAESPARIQTLMRAHDAVVVARPAPDAPVWAWRAYYLRSARVYAEVAEIDRGHHHEALYWAGRERRKAEELDTEPGDTAST